MELDYRTIQMNLGASGSYSAQRKLVGPIRTVMDTDGKIHSGVIRSLTVIVSGSDFKNDISFIFSESSSFASSGSVEEKTGLLDTGSLNYTPTFSDLQNILGVVSASGSLGNNTTMITPLYSISTFLNVGIPFNCDSLYMASVFNGENTSSFNSGSIWATVGYELGQAK